MDVEDVTVSSVRKNTSNNTLDGVRCELYQEYEDLS